jgi:triosephosphate isomerase
MLNSVGVHYVLIGHSERRQVFKETDEDFNKSLQLAMANNLVPILCIGETLEEYEKGLNEEVVTTQLSKCLKDVSNDDVSKIVIAYEPVWAIGTGKVATPEIAQSVHLAIRNYMRKTYGDAIADGVRIQYGGSVSPESVDNLMKCPDIDGALVGGASLTAASFARIAKFE